MGKTFPAVQPGGSLILAWQVKNRRVLVVGGGEVAAGRILSCLNADALVTVICPSTGLNEEVAHRIAHKQVLHIDRLFEPSDLDAPPFSSSPTIATASPSIITTATSTTTTTTTPEARPSSPKSNKNGSHRSNSNGSINSKSTIISSKPSAPDMVLVAVDDPAASTQIWKLCKERKIPANIADVPSECDFYFGSVHRDGPLQIMVSTNGKGPRLAAAIRKYIAAGLPRNAGNAIESIGELRSRLRRVAPNSEESPKRMRWMSKVSDNYKWEEMCGLSSEDMDNLLLFYPANKVPTVNALQALRGGNEAKKLDVFDGSFGFSVGC